MKLPRIQTDHQGFALLELDNSQQWFEKLGLDSQASTNFEVITKLLSHILTSSPASVSGIVLDPLTGISLASTKPSHAGILWQLEEPNSGLLPAELPKISPDWTVEHIRNNLGLAKLELRYHPAEPLALTKKQLVAELHDFCQYQDIDLLLKLTVILPEANNTPEAWQMAQLTAVQEFRDQCEAIAIEAPKDALATATVTAELDIPWLIFSTDKQKYEVFKDQVRQSLEAGAKGYLIADTLWQELYSLRRKDHGVDEQRALQFIQTTVRDRLIELHRILGECLAV